jgi:peptidoglycan/xylan/chitin deacetylase (PgdA/CDA1 family)
VRSLATFLERFAVTVAAVAWAGHFRPGRSRRAAHTRALVGGGLGLAAVAVGLFGAPLTFLRARGRRSRVRATLVTAVGMASAVVVAEEIARRAASEPIGGELDARAAAVARSGRVVALTFDDGPSREFTPAVLDVLRRERVTATFFVVGECALAEPDLFQSIVDSGHEIGCHTMSHASLVGLDEGAFAEEVDRGCALLATMSGRPIRRLRPPFGNWDDLTRHRLAERSLDMSMWTVDPQDYLHEADDIVAIVARRARPSGVVLLHDGQGDRTATVEALPRLITALRRRGFRFVTLDDLGRSARAYG